MGRKIISGFMGGIILVVILWIFVSLNKNTLGYGMAILPLILISVLLFIIGFVMGIFIFKCKKKQNGKKGRKN